MAATIVVEEGDESYLEQTPQPPGLFNVLIGDDVHDTLPFRFGKERKRKEKKR
jgi:hypothetical protein